MMDRALLLLLSNPVPPRLLLVTCHREVVECFREWRILSTLKLQKVLGSRPRPLVWKGGCVRDNKQCQDRERRLVKCDELTREGASKTFTINEIVELLPILQPSEFISFIHVEVSPHQRWTVEIHIHIHVFQVFDFSQDLSAYVDKFGAEIAERCLTRGGRVILVYSLLSLFLPPFNFFATLLFFNAILFNSFCLI